MVKKASVKDIVREIRKTASRFVSIILMLVLSVAFFTGLRATQPDMRLTADAYMDAHGMYDLRVRSTLGLSDDDIAALGKTDGVALAAGLKQFDAVAASEKQDIVVSVETLSEAGINSPEVLSGRLPSSPDECAVEDRFLAQTGLRVGDSFAVKEVQSGFDGALRDTTFKIVGLVRSPLYISKVQRGSSTLGSGSVAAYIVIPAGAVTLDYYTQADILVSGAADETAYTDEYSDTVKTVSDRIDALGQTQAQKRYDEVYNKANGDLRSAGAELDEKKAELEDARQRLNDARAQLADGQAAYAGEKARADSALQKARGTLDASAGEIAKNKADLDAAQKQLDAQKAAGEAQINAAQNDLSSKQAALNDAYAAYNAARAAYEEQLAQFNALPDSIKQTMPDTARQLEEAGARLAAQKQQLDAQQAALTAGLQALDSQSATLNEQTSAAQRQLDTGKASLLTAQRQLDDGRRQYESQKAEADKRLAGAAAQLKDAEAQLADSEAQVEDGADKLAQGEKDIQDAAAKIADIPQGKWYVQDRSGNAGYQSFGEDADRIGALGGVFPVIFFAVAALVCLTTMTRMVDEKRVEIGTYKALGHSRLTTAGKFVYYSLSATVIGVAGGLAAGLLGLPQFIFKAYSILYDLPPLLTPVQAGVCVTAGAAALICTVGATTAACLSALRETPASLLRPKAPEPGKRVLLEYITNLWKKMSFFAKVSARNIFRYKKRLVMTLLGIAGCTALIVTGFGLRDSITDIADIQFGRIFHYNLLAYLPDGAGEDAASVVLKDSAGVTDYLFEQSTAADFTAGSGTVDGQVIVPDDPDRLGDFVRLAHRADGRAVALTDDGAVITEKMAELLNLHPGDTFTVEADGKYNVKVADIVENYVYHYVYMTPGYYKEVFGRDEKANQAFIRLKEDTDSAADQVSSEILKDGGVAYVSHFTSVAKTFRDSMNSVNAVVVIILVSAALLAFVVLYNLTNINITERTRELATIKVLGFYDREVSWYIVRENMILTVIGAALGLVGGKFLHAWLVRTVELSFVMFGRTPKPSSYILAALLTFLFAVAVNFIGQRHIKRINMVESLKTNE
ncbi:putative ABC transport system permease protein [Sporobacter termitidis DSM 10068]|uniref:Putative ABC transport system permease protein n=1 Tax=Sporobacter termitidis DSM 10068 TaxID=1123282 RepID=A0A1M5Z671_9FIRM|nr:FtsX-like permease family protein [Sporobacter termitidis]SHI19785.1 putative ABC transport system permease protein [Sporobacter termitidis DSM 10068]